ncbi:MAG: penicillin-binding protein activator [Sneathiella sp.]|nr:penicillin-binding protein activator [Sneathiella sp.]
MTAQHTCTTKAKSDRMAKVPAIFTCLALVAFLSACQTMPFGQSSSENKATSAKSNSNTEIAIPAPSATSPQFATEKEAAEKLLQTENTVNKTQKVYKRNPPLFSLRPPELLEEKIIKIAILLPLSGRHNAIGNDLLKAAYMALFDHGNKNLRLLPYDTVGTPEGARQAALDATGEGAEIILGPLFSASVTAVRPIAAANNINVLAFSTDTTVAGDGVYLMGLTANQQISRIMEFSYRQGLERFAVLAPQSAYGDTVIQNVQRTSQQLGLSVDKIMRYPTNLEPGSEELHSIAKGMANYEQRRWQLKQEIKRLKGKKDAASKSLLKKLLKRDTLGNVTFDALIIPDGGQRLRELAPLLSYYDIDPAEVQFIGTGLWADQSLTSEPALVGGWFAAPNPAKTDQFKARFQQIYNYLPPHIASLAYDAAALSGLLALDEQGNKFSRTVLENPDGFSGYNGIFRFPSSGIAERGLAVMQVGPQTLELVEPAPQSFELLIN